jgi:hypothetical protein
MARNYDNGTLVYVTLSNFGGLRYGFKSRIRSASREDLGQTVIDASIADITGLAVGVNSPKPARAKKIFASGSEGSFCSTDKIPTLKANGWQITRGRARSLTRSSFGKVVYVTINGLKYAWFLTQGVGYSAANLAAAGIKDAEPEDLLVYGASFPKPPRVKLKHTQGDFSTFADPEKLDAAFKDGWKGAGGAFSAKTDLFTLL